MKLFINITSIIISSRLIECPLRYFYTHSFLFHHLAARYRHGQDTQHDGHTAHGSLNAHRPFAGRFQSVREGLWDTLRSDQCNKWCRRGRQLAPAGRLHTNARETKDVRLGDNQTPANGQHYRAGVSGEARKAKHTTVPKCHFTTGFWHSKRLAPGAAASSFHMKCA